MVLPTDDAQEAAPMPSSPACPDRGRPDRRRAAGPRRRHRLRAARRADLRPVRQPGPRRRPDPGDRRPARADRGLHGVRVRAGDRPHRRLHRRARPRRPQRLGRDALGVRGQRAGAVPDQRDPPRVPRPRARAPARDARPARHPADDDQVVGAGRAPGRDPGRAGDRVPRSRGRAAEAGFAGRALGRAGPACPRRGGRPAAAASPGRRPGRRGARPRNSSPAPRTR